jgi:hypothetical protein
MDWLTKYAEIPDRERIRWIAEILAIGIERYARQKGAASPAVVEWEKPSTAKPLRVAQLVTDATERRIVAHARALRSSMNWKRMLAYISGSVDQELLLQNEYLVRTTRSCSRQQQTGSAVHPARSKPANASAAF